MQYYENMKRIREMKGITQTKISERMNILQQQYQRYEAGKTEMPVRYLKEFCIIMNVSADEILELN